MPKEIYIKNIKRLNNEIKSTSAKISKLEKNRDKFYSNPKYRFGNKLEMNFNKETKTLKDFKKISDEKPELFKLRDKKAKLQNLKTKNQDLLMKAEKKGLI